MFNTLIFLAFLCREQPPPRGCVLKLNVLTGNFDQLLQPPPRGCVLKPYINRCAFNSGCAAASARLCVETWLGEWFFDELTCSRLRAAVC